ncbi:anhydro-N-acetylmuramic acid kinase [Marinibaculum pumilum]|uniref:Anhydro-N-acetylmuramic acid kinase n=1 Tax=Marinibaculum pumilum TaxID=1766165 RepID=A0ABV7KWH5_9PROT
MRWAIGTMSGTSLDGIDVAALRTDGQRVLGSGASATYPYDPAVREAIRAVLGETDPDRLAAAEAAVTVAHARAVTAFLAEHAIAPADVAVVGFHGHTVHHDPDAGQTVQIGDGAALAAALGIDVVYDFRTADMRAGGQGAPLVPVFHDALASGLERPLAILNIGGVANVTYLGPQAHPGQSGAPAEELPMLAFDTGPGNALIDDWMRRHTGSSLDAGGAMAAGGSVDAARLDAFLALDWFRRPPPKSLDRNSFPLSLADGLSPADGAATLTEMTAAAISAAVRHMAVPPRRWLVCGGGRHNRSLMERLRRRLQAPVAPVEAVGWDGDALEAQAFAFLAVRRLRGLAITTPGTTGAARPMPGGRIAPAPGGTGGLAL